MKIGIGVGLHANALLGGRGGGTTPPVFPSVPSSGLVNDWSMDDANVSGATIKDLAGTLDGTASGGVTSGGYARKLDGTGIINLASCPVAAFSSAHSIFVWAEIDDPTAETNSVSQTILNFSNGVGTGVRIAVDDGSLDNFPAADLVVSLQIGAVGYGAETTFTEKAWKKGVMVMMGYTFDGTNIVLYKNEDVAGTKAVSWSTTDNQNVIGAKDTSGDGGVVGSIGRVLVYDRAITATEVAQIHRAGLLGIPNRKRTCRMTIVAGSGSLPNSYVEWSLPDLQVCLARENLSIYGETFNDFNTNFATWVEPYFDSNRDLNLLVLQCTNDLDAGTSAAQTYDYAASIAAKWKALGPSAKVLMIGAWGYSGYATAITPTAALDAHAAFNDLVQQAVPGTFDGYVNTFDIPGLNTGTAALSTTYSADGDHLTPAGHQLVVPYFVAGVNAIWTR